MKMPRLIASTARLPHIAPSQPDKIKSPGNKASVLLPIGTIAPLHRGQKKSRDTLAPRTSGLLLQPDTPSPWKSSAHSLLKSKHRPRRVGA
jgi:hypothetical protein